MRKGQTMQMFSFLVLSITVIAVIIFMRTYLASNYGRGLAKFSERHETEGLRAGGISILQTTDDNTDKTLIELLGVASYYTDRNLDFGEGGSVDIFDELEWRMNEIYGEGKWYIRIPYPDVIPRYQMIMIVDSSGSLCDDFDNIRNNLPQIIEDLRDDGFNVAATIFMLPGGQRCCSGGTLTCENLFDTERYLHCINLVANINNEDWAMGLSEAIERGPYEGWYDFTAKIGVILSDELPGGSEGGPSGEKNNFLRDAVDSANGVNSHGITMQVFPFKATTGSGCCSACGCDLGCILPESSPSPCSDCLFCLYSGGSEFQMFNDDSCRYDSDLSDYMQIMADDTQDGSGTFYELGSADDASETIRQIFEDHEFTIDPYMELGTTPPSNKNINSVITPVPVPFVGGYTNIYINTWA